MKNNFFNKIIQKQLIKYKIKKLKIETPYEITDNLVVNFNGNVNLADKGLTEIPFKMGEIKGDFNCGNNKLKSLINGPSVVSGDYFCDGNLLYSLEGVALIIGNNFDCSFSLLKSLSHGPTHVGKNYNCSNNQLINLEGVPKVIYGDFNCFKNVLESLKDGPEIVKEVYYCNENPIKTWVYLPKEVQYFRWHKERKDPILSFDDVCKLKEIEDNYSELNNNLVSVDNKRKRIKI